MGIVKKIIDKEHKILKEAPHDALIEGPYTIL
jgi:hypothetical protein